MDWSALSPPVTGVGISTSGLRGLEIFPVGWSLGGDTEVGNSVAGSKEGWKGRSLMVSFSPAFYTAKG